MPKYRYEQDEKPDVVDEVKPKYNSGTKQVQSIYSAHLKYIGAVSGKLYEWYKSGEVVAVDERDVTDLLAKRIGSRNCCGDSLNGNIVFQLFEN